MLAARFTTDILNRLFSVGHAHIETPLLQLKVAELSLSESSPLVTHALTAHSQLVIQAVLMALWQRKSRESVVLHSDRGSQFTSHEYQQFLAGHNITCSMNAVGSCYDNAAVESFFGLLKRERVNRRRYVTRAEARADVFEYIELTYNPRKRRKLEQPSQTALN